ncbi:hypothetical protein DW757_09535 [Clostridium sp. AM29-11AC]|nr:hypothetical protein CLOM621_07524 [Clostridium sp. M62/1]RHT56481.1 hypothetical protein DW757_09535 [Clostridium sp. AM29-11AC]
MKSRQRKANRENQTAKSKQRKSDRENQTAKIRQKAEGSLYFQVWKNRVSGKEEEPCGMRP